MVAPRFHEPMGQNQDTAIDFCALAAQNMLELAEKVEDASLQERLRKASEKALDFCVDMERPEAGDFWETPCTRRICWRRAMRPLPIIWPTVR